MVNLNLIMHAKSNGMFKIHFELKASLCIGGICADDRFFCVWHCLLVPQVRGCCSTAQLERESFCLARLIIKISFLSRQYHLMMMTNTALPVVLVWISAIQP